MIKAYHKVKKELNFNLFLAGSENIYKNKIRLMVKKYKLEEKVFLSKKILDNDLKYGQSKYKIAEDLDLWVRMHGHGAIFGNVDDIVLKYRILEDSLSRVNKKALAKDTKDIFGFFYKKNYLKSVNLINKLPILLNSEESSLIVRFLYVSLIKNMNILNLRHLKRVKSKIIIYSVLSEMVR